MMAFGLVLFAISCLELVPITKDWAFSELFIPQALRGVALMTSMLPVSMLALGTLPPERMKNASGLFNLTRNLGGAVGLAVITTVLNDRWDLHISRLHDSVQWGREVATERLAALSRGLSALGSNAEVAALQTMAQSVKREALVMAFSDVFLLLAAVFALIVLLVPLAQKPQPRAAGAGGGH
jgi:DHA2 family multidrug resistance protein